MPPDPSSDVLVQKHDGCDYCEVAVRSFAGTRLVELFNHRTGRPLVTLEVAPDAESWLPGAIQRAADHARGR